MSDINIFKKREESKESEEEEDSYDPIEDKFLHTAFKKAENVTEDLGLDTETRDPGMTFIIGKTGSGKSTLANYFEGSTLSAKFHKTCWLFSGDANSKAKIGNKACSCTNLPTRIMGSDGITVYNDFPGFFDTRGTEREIACSFYLKTLIDSTQWFRIVLILDFKMFDNRSRDLIDLLTYLQKLFPKVKLLLRALFVVVTKVPENVNIEDIQSQVREFIIDGERIPKNTEAILERLADPERLDRIEIFRAPTRKEKSDTKGEIDLEGLSNIVRKLEFVPFIVKQAIKLRVPEGTQLQIQKLTQRLQKRMDNEVVKMIRKTEEICEKKIQNERYEDLEKFIEDITEHVAIELGNQQSQDDSLPMLSKYAKKIRNSICVGIEPLQLKDFERTYESITKLTKLISTTKINDELWRWQFQALRNRMTEVLKFKCIEEAPGILKINGIVLNTRKIAPFLKEDLTRVEICCLSGIFFDNLNIECKGTNIAIIAPLWKILGSNTININGREGSPHRERGDNFDGKPGNPGHNAGNFLGICHKFIGSHDMLLTIKANGGRGGRGENGQHEWERLENRLMALDLQKPQGQMKRDAPPRKEINPYQSVYSALSPTIPTREKRGGKCGCGGVGGNRGQIEINLDANMIVRPNIIVEKNPGGEGVKGKPGRKREEAPLSADTNQIQKKKKGLGIPFMCCGALDLHAYDLHSRRVKSDKVDVLAPQARLGRSNSSYTIRNDSLIDLLSEATGSLNRSCLRVNENEINREGLREPAANEFPFNEEKMKEIYNRYYDEVTREENFKNIIGDSPF